MFALGFTRHANSYELGLLVTSSSLRSVATLPARTRAQNEQWPVPIMYFADIQMNNTSIPHGFPEKRDVFIGL